MALNKQTLVAFAVVVAAAALLASAAITCGQVGSALSSCIPYATGRGTLIPGCCSGVRSLNSADRQAACRCLKSLANSIKRINMGTVSGRCGVSVPFPISMSTDCNNKERKG